MFWAPCNAVLDPILFQLRSKGSCRTFLRSQFHIDNGERFTADSTVGPSYLVPHLWIQATADIEKYCLCTEHIQLCFSFLLSPEQSRVNYLHSIYNALGILNNLEMIQEGVHSYRKCCTVYTSAFTHGLVIPGSICCEYWEWLRSVLKRYWE